MKKRLFLAYLLNLFDLVMTLRLYRLYGIGIEGNPMGRWLIETGLAVPVKVFGIGACLIALYAAVQW